MSLWDWAVKAYGREGVSEACIQLQDYFDQNVCLLLWAGWCAETGRRPDEEEVEAACDIARAWQDTTIAPLRSVRRTLKKPVPDLDAAAREAVRNRVKAVELEAEKYLLAQLEALIPVPNGAARPVLDAMVQCARQWDKTVPRPALTTLAQRLSA
ncbi:MULTISPECIES: TIGR02444 family protein [unclassified Brevundimonas]|uniref:TIGR02444 family protein n=1 Tax=unclassified Brevundimonas TaxID=2622653 RepID=UPI0025C676F9|nr:MULTISPECIES: TIGR02444 family protein [unclassified Brevundimonas]